MNEFSYRLIRYRPEDAAALVNDSITTWLLTCICAQQCIRNPYVVAKLVEVLFVLSSQPNVNQQVTSLINAIYIFNILSDTLVIVDDIVDNESSTISKCLGWCSHEILH